MSLLSQVKKGRIKQPILCIIYGVDGVGKSTFGAEAPEVIFYGPEKGTGNMDVARYPKEPKTFDDVTEALDDIIQNPHGFQSLAVDSLDWMETLVWSKVAADNKVKSIEDIGYAKGYIYALDYWKEFIGKVTELREKRGMHIILIAHSHSKLAKDPQNQTEYDRYQLKLHDKAAALLRESVDCVLFANYETSTVQEKGSGKVRAFGDGTRLLFTERRPGFDAKNRFALAPELPMERGKSWSVFYQACNYADLADPKALKKAIAGLCENVASETKAVVEQRLVEAGDDATKLEVILKRLQTITAAA